ncbi:MAG: OmpA family protein [Gammaproteobacteria bacterium]|jgi:outer membrane protein OmpA-like peptidoglycan-associated protein|nr:OmpA family protein [Gammaproteobacteria bacterium]
MNTHSKGLSRGILVAAGVFLITACATPLKAPDGADTARAKLTSLQSNAQLANRAPVEIRAAEAAVTAAELPRKDTQYARHLVLVADRKVDTARARAQSRLYEDQRQALSEQSERVRLEARTMEADSARADARSARADADSAREQAEIARLRADAAAQDTAELRRQIEELNARETDRGLVVTLGDLLFATGRSDLTGGAGPNLDKLANFLREYPDRTVLIEGHTDSVGSESSNFLLSERRADSVKSYLVRQGIESGRISTAGLGQGSPVAGNDTATGRQQNRRVEVIISNVRATAR